MNGTDLKAMLADLEAMTPEQLEAHIQKLVREEIIQAISLSSCIKAIKIQEGTKGLKSFAERHNLTDLRIHALLRVWDEFCRQQDALGDAEAVITAIGKSKTYQHLKDIQATEEEMQ